MALLCLLGCLPLPLLWLLVAGLALSPLPGVGLIMLWAYIPILISILAVTALLVSLEIEIASVELLAIVLGALAGAAGLVSLHHHIPTDTIAAGSLLLARGTKVAATIALVILLPVLSGELAARWVLGKQEKNLDPFLRSLRIAGVCFLSAISLQLLLEALAPGRL